MQGSRKHSRYEDGEVVVGIPFGMAGEIEEAWGGFRGHGIKKI